MYHSFVISERWLIKMLYTKPLTFIKHYTEFFNSFHVGRSSENPFNF